MELERSLLMGRRLKMLRERKGLSHIKLAEALSEKYGISIKKDSLMSYEVSEIPHNRAGANAKMRVEYLDCLADFYGVSYEFILGISDIESPSQEIRSISKLTGLSEETVTFLCYTIASRHHRRNLTLEDNEIRSFFSKMCLPYSFDEFAKYNDNFPRFINKIAEAYIKDPEIQRYYNLICKGAIIPYNTSLDSPIIKAGIFDDDLLPILCVFLAEHISKFL